MRTTTEHLENYRVKHGQFCSDSSYGMTGAFVIPYATKLFVIAHDGLSVAPHWEHVSVSCDGRCPTWDEMCYIKSLFWEDEETVIQFHPKQSAYINSHRFCLHLWRKVDTDIELPPSIFIGV